MGTIQLGWTYRGFDVVTLENEHVRVSVVPEIGAKVFQFIDKRIDRDLLFHHPRLELRTPVFGANVDNYWTGGIDDAVPTGHPCVVGDEELPFLGEVWSMGWTWEQISPNAVRFTRDGVITPFRLTRTMTLLPGDSFVTVDYELASLGLEPFPYLWGIHPGLPIGRQTHVDVPAHQWRKADGTHPLGRDDGDDDPTSGVWPINSLTRPGPEPKLTWVHLYLSELDSGWLAVSDQDAGWGFGMRFPTDTFPSVHIWMVDGGWRGIRCVAVEPWTGQPARLDQAIASGAARTLTPGASVHASVQLIAFKPNGTVRGFTAAGDPL